MIQTSVRRQDIDDTHQQAIASSQFRKALADGDIEACRQILERRPGLFAALTNLRETYAMQAMSLQEIEAAVDVGHLNAMAHRGSNIDLMCQAAQYGRVDVMQWLWSQRERLGYEPAGLSHALISACSSGRVDAARWVLDQGVSASTPSYFVYPDGSLVVGDFPLITAADFGVPELVDLLIERGADPNAADERGYCPILLAAKHGQSVVDPLLKAGARLDARLDPERSYEGLDLGVLSFALTTDSDEPFHYLLSLGLDVTGHEDALLSAAEAGRLSLVRRMIDLGVDVNHQGRKWKVTALMLASAHRHGGVVQSLLAAGADPNLVASDGRTALVFAAKSGNLKVVDRLIEAGASPACVEGGKTFWQWISRQDQAVKRHIRAALTAQRLEDAMGGSDMDHSSPKKSTAMTGMSPL